MAAAQGAPPDWASLTPGAELGALLARVDLPAVPDEQLTGVLQGCWRQISHLQAQWWAAMVEIGRREPATDGSHPWREVASWEWGSNQISAALTFTTRRADSEYQLARQLVQKLPLVFAALQAGVIDPPKAKVFVSYLAELTDRQIARISARLLPGAPGWTTGQLAYRLLRAVLAIDPGFTRRRYRAAVRERGVWGYLAEDGTAVLSGHGLSPTEAAAAAERVEQLAAAVRAAGHRRTEQQLRADLFVRLLDGRYTGFTRDQIITAMLTDTDTDTDTDTHGDGDADAGPVGEPVGEPTPGSHPDPARGAQPADTTTGAEPATTSTGTRPGPTGSRFAATSPRPTTPASTAPTPAAGPEPAGPEAAEPAEPEPGNREPAGPEPAEPEAAEPAEPEPGNREPAGPEPAEPEPAEPEPAEPEPAEPEPAEPEPAEPEPSNPDTADPNTADPEPAGPEPAISEPEPEAAQRNRPATNPTTATPPAQRPPEPARPPTPPPSPPAEGMRTGIEVRIALSTLLGLDDHPAELPGWGPIDAETARQLINRQHTAEWRFALLDDTGHLILGGLTRRRPTTNTGAGARGGRTRGGTVEIHIAATQLTNLAGRDDLPPDWLNRPGFGGGSESTGEWNCACTEEVPRRVA